jgi:hypothetical protein
MATPLILGQPMPATAGDPSDGFQHGFNAQGRYQMAFSDSTHAASWHNAVTMAPEADPKLDQSIEHVLGQRVDWTATMIHAVYDTQTSTDVKALNMFKPGSADYITPPEIDAGYHALFDQVIFRCLYGYRGMSRFNLLTGKGRQGDNGRGDAEANCLTRITNLVVALRVSKSICQEIILDDSKAKRLANAPMMLMAKKGIENTTNKNKAKKAAKLKQAEVELEGVKKQGEGTIGRPTLQGNGQLAASGSTEVPAAMPHPAPNTHLAQQSTLHSPAS